MFEALVVAVDSVKVDLAVPEGSWVSTVCAGLFDEVGEGRAGKVAGIDLCCAKQEVGGGAN